MRSSHLEQKLREAQKAANTYMDHNKALDQQLSTTSKRLEDGE
jgi:hypothetical protein